MLQSVLESSALNFSLPGQSIRTTYAACRRTIRRHSWSHWIEDHTRSWTSKWIEITPSNPKWTGMLFPKKIIKTQNLYGNNTTAKKWPLRPSGGEGEGRGNISRADHIVYRWPEKRIHKLHPLNLPQKDLQHILKHFEDFLKLSLRCHVKQNGNFHIMHCHSKQASCNLSAINSDNKLVGITIGACLESLSEDLVDVVAQWILAEDMS